MSCLPTYHCCYRLWAPAFNLNKFTFAKSSTVSIESTMSTANGKVLEFFTKIPKLEANGSNWVIFKDCFLFAVAAASLSSHIDGTGAEPTLAPGIPRSGVLLESQQEKLNKFTSNFAQWQSDEAIIRQVIASSILDSLFLEVRKKEMAMGMWEAVKEQRKKKSQMVTVDMHRKLQAVTTYE